MQSNSLIIPQIQIQLLNKQEVNVIFQLEVQLENETDELTINLIVKTLKNMGFPLRNQFIMYTSQAYNINILCGYDPFNSNIVLQKEDYQKGLIISVIDSQKPLINQLVQNDINEIKQLKKKNQQREIHNKDYKCRRTKERKIGYIIEKVFEWRKFYNGLQGLKYSLEEAAQQVKISKKSLDDYLQQIRKGKMYGFNFNEHFDEKVGVLRNYVKKCENEKKLMQTENNN